MDSLNQARLLKRVQELSFIAVELNLYLDTHPEDKQALEMYNKVHHDFLQAVRRYEEAYGPLVNFGYSPEMSSKSWRWVETPWPWEIKY